MDEKNKNKNEKTMDVSSLEVGEDATKYGEFISSFFEWNTLEGQRRKAEKLENITDNKKRKNKN
ncbi:MAG: hypothetical protein IKF38_07690 [Clostridia bacterium]|nr:hypothetical protein [Clostridia bacterium]MBR3163624.1 hypothetical protein [Clostridia bacterium]